MSLAAQSKLLRVLEEGRVRRVGENRVTPVDTRVLAATGLDLEADISRREFREDLYFRLSALELLRRYPFPGNVRELKHAVEQAAVFGDSEVLKPADFRALWARSQMLLPVGEPKGGRASIDDVTPAKLEEALARTGGNRLEAARVLGISRSSLYRVLRRMPPVDLGTAG